MKTSVFATEVCDASLQNVAIEVFGENNRNISTAAMLKGS